MKSIGDIANALTKKVLLPIFITTLIGCETHRVEIYTTTQDSNDPADAIVQISNREKSKTYTDTSRGLSIMRLPTGHYDLYVENKECFELLDAVYIHSDTTFNIKLKEKFSSIHIAPYTTP
jgi:hypothetical protein